MPKMRTDDGVEIHYHVEDYRDPWADQPGDTIMLTHGFARSMVWWTQWVPGLSRKYRVVRYDIRGCGKSSEPPEGAEWSEGRLAKDALNLIDHLGIQKIHWVGFESGGLWGITFASTYPERVKSLTVISTPLHKGGAVGNRATVIREGGLRQWLSDTVSTRLDLSLADPKLVRWHLDEHSKTPSNVAASITEVVQTIDISQMIPQIEVPTLIMVGGNSPDRPLDMMRSMESMFPNAKLKVFPGITNGLHLLIPDQCIEEVLKHVEGL